MFYSTLYLINLCQVNKIYDNSKDKTSQSPNFLSSINYKGSLWNLLLVYFSSLLYDAFYQNNLHFVSTGCKPVVGSGLVLILGDLKSIMVLLLIFFFFEVKRPISNLRCSSITARVMNWYYSFGKKYMLECVTCNVCPQLFGFNHEQQKIQIRLSNFLKENLLK